MGDETVVFRVGNSLAVRLVGDCKLPRGQRVRERREGNRIVLEPVSEQWPDDFIGAAGAWPEAIPRPGQGEKPRDPFA